ncbi:sporulation protein YpjB [Lederbergia citrea]|uniref:sporulation protein YpjB n=1 Tax=Lederbergia citrea TaxID=2833581 RepID=UPI001BC928B7|nr:sporulation protein YpjB [Lederbergia citrea]MBS4176576.1 sporulation protein YpjB [Lederbergia citrea]
MKYKPIILLWLCILFISSSVYAKSQSAMGELDQLADEALQFTRVGRYEDAKGLLERFGVLFSKTRIADQPLTMDELRIVTAAHHDALKAITNVSLNQEDRIRRVTAFRLATDAVTSKYQPLWSDMEKPVMDAFQQVKNAALEGDADLYNLQLNEFLATYSVIQPSIKIDIPVDKVQKLDSKITYLDRYRSRVSEQSWMKELESFEADLKSLFAEINKDDLDPSIWWVIIMTGSIIVTTLSYVSWRKYKGQKLQKKTRDPID